MRCSRIKSQDFLNANYAEQIISLEEEIALDCKLESVQKLIMLYSKAIEWYELQNDPKHYFYQERIHELLSRKEVQSALRSVPNSPTTESVYVQQKKQQLERRQHSFSSQHRRSNSNFELVIDRSTEKMMQEHIETTNKTAINLQANIYNQSQTLSKRLFMRRQSKQPKLNEPVKCLQEIDKIMEKYAEEKFQALQNDETSARIKDIDLQKNRELKQLHRRISQ